MPESELDAQTAANIARQAYSSSTNWLNSGRRAKWNDNNRAFLSMHPTGSKYLSRDYSYRSSLYRPKTRATIRKAEAQTAAAFFANEDVVSIQAEDDDDPMQKASADFMKELLQHRLTKTIPWFLTLVGARQDAEVLGIAVAHAYWKYDERYSHTERRPKMDPRTQMPSTTDDGKPAYEEHDIYEKIEDEPAIDLIAPENIRFEPGCDWRDVVGTSPYIIQLVPMYIQDIKAKIADGEWLEVSESAMRSANDIDDDVTRRSRETGRVPGKDHDAWKPMDYDIGWCRRNIIKWGGEDWTFWTLGSAGELLSEPKRLKEVELHGKRPYVVGFVILETHRTYPSGKPELVRDLQRAANDDWNMRFDQLKLSLNPRQFVKSSAGIEISDARTFMPGKVVLTKDPATDIIWDRPPEPSQAAYAEQDRINMDFDDIVGDFSNSSVQSGQLQQQSATGMHLMSGSASGMNEYELRVFAESFVEPLLKLLIRLEQAYETDPVILAIAGKNAKLIQKYGINQITDELLNQELTMRVNVGIGATNPQMRLHNFQMGADIIGKIFGQSAAMGTNFQEVCSEVFGLLGYKDGKRFFQPEFDPRVQMLQEQMQKMQGKGKQGAQPDPYKLEAAKVTSQARLQGDQMKSQADIQMAQMDYRSQMEKEQNENWRLMFKAGHEHSLAGLDRMHEGAQAHQDRMHQTGMAQQDQMHQAGMAAQGQIHDQSMAQQDQFHDQGMASMNQGHEMQMQAMQPPPAASLRQPSGGQQGGSPTGLQPHEQMIVEGLRREQQMGGGMQEMMQMFAHAMGAVVQAVQQGNSELAQMMGQIAQKQDMASATVARALTAPKRIVRGDDGRAVGTETVLH